MRMFILAAVCCLLSWSNVSEAGKHRNRGEVVEVITVQQTVVGSRFYTNATAPLVSSQSYAPGAVTACQPQPRTFFHCASKERVKASCSPKIHFKSFAPTCGPKVYSGCSATPTSYASPTNCTSFMPTEYGTQTVMTDYGGVNTVMNDYAPEYNNTVVNLPSSGVKLVGPAVSNTASVYYGGAR